MFLLNQQAEQQLHRLLDNLQYKMFLLNNEKLNSTKRL